MTPAARRGRQILLVLITPIVVDCAAAIVVALSGEWQSIHWTAQVLLPLAILTWFGSLFQTGHWSSLALSVIHSLFPGAGLIILCIPTNRLTLGTPFGHLAGWPSAVVIVLGLWYLTAGLAFVLSPSVRAFFAHQREKALPPNTKLDSESKEGTG